MRHLPVVVVAAAITAAACSSTDVPMAVTTTTTTTAAPTTTTTDPEPRVRYPDAAGWAREAPADAGFDPTALDGLAARAEAARSSCLVVTRDGAVVDERYWGGGAPATTREAFSVTKSVTGMLVGIAADDGRLTLADPASLFIPQWVGTPSANVTVEDLLSNDSGRHWDLSTDYHGMAIAADDKTSFAIALGQDAPPGHVWAYNNAAVQTLSAVLEAATGVRPDAYAKARLFDRIGMASSHLSTDPAWNVLTFMGLQTTCLDLARFGYLALNGGEWNGQQIVSRAFVERATQQPSSMLNAAYGYLWWLNRRGPITTAQVALTVDDASTSEVGQLAPGLPDDVFWALGLHNQVVAVIPSERIVAVRLGDRPPPDARFTHVELTTGVLDALADDSAAGGQPEPLHPTVDGQDRAGGRR